jgi:hypothetical protein
MFLSFMTLCVSTKSVDGFYHHYIPEICKEYKNILLGNPITVFIDHKNHIFSGSKASDCVTLAFAPGRI